MDPIALGIAAGAGLVAMGVARWSAAIRAGAWKHAAEVARLTEVRLDRTAGFVTRLHGQAGALSVVIEAYARGKHSRGTRVVVGGLQHAPDELAIRRESLGSAVGKALGRGEIELGDPAFDEVVYLQGSARLACAVLDSETRARVRHMMDGYYYSPSERLVSLGDTRAWVSYGELCLELRAADQTSVALPSLLAIASRLVRPPDIGARLAENLGREPHEKVRLSILQVLLEGHHKHPRAQEALLQAAREDRSDEVRLRAALALGIRGWETLIEIASKLTPLDQRSARAIAGLGDRLSTEQAKAILAQSLRTRRLQTAQACLESLGRRGGEEIVELLKNVLAVEAGALVVAAAQALAATGDASAEAALIEELSRHPPEVGAAIAAVLGSVGTVAAVMPLREAADRQGGDLRRAARQAIAEIQSRLQGAAPGQLSLATGEIGLVSLVGPDARGGLSLPGEADES